MKKVKFLLFLCSPIFVLPIALPLATCVNTTPQINEQKVIALEIDSSDQTLSSLRNKTVIEWKEILENQNSEQSILFDIIKTNLSTTEEPFNWSNDMYVKTVTQVTNSNNYSLSNLNVKIDNINEIIDVTIKNLFIYGNSLFTPPTTYTYTFDQTSLSQIEEIEYKNINDSQWTNAFNNTLVDGFIIPPIGYYIVSKELEPVENPTKIIITYGMNPIYQSQINSLPNADQFKDIVITVNLSPYNGKTYRDTFTLSSNNGNKNEIEACFGEGATFESINALPELEIYNKLKDYVSTLENGTVQPLRNCISTTNANKIVEFSKTTSIGNTSMKIVFSSNSTYIKKYFYTFVLQFNK